MTTKLVILHVSDLHFGPYDRFAAEPPASVGKRLVQALDELRTRAGFGPIDLVVASGDLTATARPQEFEQARAFFEAIVGELGLERDRFAFVPGNHDFSWAKIELARAQQRDEEFDDTELEQRIHATKFVHYDKFIADFYGEFAADMRRISLTPSGWVQELPQLGISLGLLNSSERETDKRRGGAISTAQAQALLSYWRANAQPRLRIAVVHHNPKSNIPSNVEYIAEEMKKKAVAGKVDAALVDHFVSDVYGFAGTQEFEQLVDQGEVSLVLHGHIHAPKVESIAWRRKGETRILAAGSMGADAGHMPSEVRNMVQLIVLDLVRGEGVVHRLEHDARALVVGSVERGNFVAVAEEVDGIGEFGLTVSKALIARTKDELRERGKGDSGFVSEYRTKLAHVHEVWELGAMQRGVREASVVTLDAMYVPLAFVAMSRGVRDQEPSPIVPTDLLTCEHNLVVRGGPGSGKTTWLRWTFRRLLERDDVLPIFVELRALAGEQLPSTLEELLQAWVERKLGPGWREAFERALTVGHPRPILLIDGWDELGLLGPRFGELLSVFADAHQEVRIVATSRPYGEGIPDAQIHFAQVEVAPMDDEAIMQFAANFFARVHRSESERVHEDVARFMQTLDANARAHELGRTPLLLVMFLLIARDQPLPDQRHDLYRVCLENLLDVRPKQREMLGVLRGSFEWTPERYAERLQTIAKLAHAMQTGRKRGENRVALARRHELVAALPDSWEPHQREGFVNWLTSGAGVMVERDDGRLQFMHLGFQEYLTAWEIDASRDSLELRLDVIRAHADNDEWWETLRLWATILDTRSPDAVDAVLERLVDRPGEQYWLVGSMLADGVGKLAFEPWLERLQQHFVAGEFELSQRCAQAWRPCQQHERRASIGARFEAATPIWSWVESRRAEAWVQSAGLKLAKPRARKSSAQWVDAALEGDRSSAPAIAWGRVWMSSSPRWGEESAELLGLRVWPTRRMWFGWLIQSAIALGMERDDVSRTPWGELDRGDVDEAAMSIANDISMDISLDIARYLAMSLAMDIAREIAMYEARYLASYIARSNARSVARSVAKDLANDSSSAIYNARSLASSLAMSNMRSLASHARSLASSLALDPNDPRILDIVLTLFFSSGFAGTRVVLAHVPNPTPSILQTAARCSLDPSLDTTPLTQPTNDHPIWPALARHIARISTPTDRADLEYLVRHPEKAGNELLAWCLQYWVRGDLMFEDGSTMTLDELWAQLRINCPDAPLPELPLLEDMPPVLKVDWNTPERPKFR